MKEPSTFEDWTIQMKKNPPAATPTSTNASSPRSVALSHEELLPHKYNYNFIEIQRYKNTIFNTLHGTLVQGQPLIAVRVEITVDW